MENIDVKKDEKREEEVEKVEKDVCYLCGKELPASELYDDGNDLVCGDCL